MYISLNVDLKQRKSILGSSSSSSGEVADNHLLKSKESVQLSPSGEPASGFEPTDFDDL